MDKEIILKVDYHEDRKYFNVEHMAREQLDGEDYDRGSVETAAATADNNSCAIGRLLDILLNGNRITLDEVRIILGYGEDVTLEKIK